MSHNQKKPSEVIRTAIRRIRNLEKEARTKAYRTGAAPLDNILNKMLEHISRIRSTASPLEPWHSLVDLREVTLRDAWKAYMNVQEYRGPESSSYSEGLREVPLQPGDDAACAVAYSGGHLGFAHVKLDRGTLGSAVPISKMRPSSRSGWWQPYGYKPKRLRDLQDSDYWVYNPKFHSVDKENDEFWRNLPSHKPGKK